MKKICILPCLVFCISFCGIFTAHPGRASSRRLAWADDVLRHPTDESNIRPRLRQSYDFVLWLSRRRLGGRALSRLNVLDTLEYWMYNCDNIPWNRDAYACVDLILFSLSRFPGFEHRGAKGIEATAKEAKELVDRFSIGTGSANFEPKALCLRIMSFFRVDGFSSRKIGAGIEAYLAGVDHSLSVQVAQKGIELVDRRFRQLRRLVYRLNGEKLKKVSPLSRAAENEEVRFSFSGLVFACSMVLLGVAMVLRNKGRIKDAGNISDAGGAARTDDAEKAGGTGVTSGSSGRNPVDQGRNSRTGTGTGQTTEPGALCSSLIFDNDAVFLREIPDRYAEARIVGRGGMGIVVLAHDTVLDRDVALKFLVCRQKDDKSLRERFVREARTLARISHPAIVTIYETAEEPFPYFTMEALAGKNLDQFISSEGPLNEESFFRIALLVCSGLAAVHKQGVIHRDIKPANVVVTGDGRVKLIDFGLARFEGSAKITDTGQIVGSPLYMSPEQLQGGELGTASDVYSLALTFYFMITGEDLFTLRNVFSRCTNAPSLKHPKFETYPPALCLLLEDCLEPDPRKRPSDASVVAGQIDTIQVEWAGVRDGKNNEDREDSRECARHILEGLSVFYAECLHVIKGKLASADVFFEEPDRFAAFFLEQGNLDELVGFFKGEQGPRSYIASIIEKSESCSLADPVLRKAVKTLYDYDAFFDKLISTFEALSDRVASGAVVNPERAVLAVKKLSVRLKEMCEEQRAVLGHFETDVGALLIERLNTVVPSEKLGQIEIAESLFRRSSSPDKDRRMIAKVFDCLLTNSLEAKAGRIDAEGSSVFEEGCEYLVFKILDNGVGMDASTLGRVFERDFTTKSAGTGTGLWWLKKKVLSIGGTICIDSGGIGRGCVCRVKFPSNI